MSDCVIRHLKKKKTLFGFILNEIRLNVNQDGGEPMYNWRSANVSTVALKTYTFYVN